MRSEQLRDPLLSQLLTNLGTEYLRNEVQPWDARNPADNSSGRSLPDSPGSMITDRTDGESNAGDSDVPTPMATRLA